MPRSADASLALAHADVSEERARPRAAAGAVRQPTVYVPMREGPTPFLSASFSVALAPAICDAVDVSETRDARPGNRPTPPRAPTQRPAPLGGASAQSPKPPAVSGAGANVARGAAGKPLGPARARMATQIGVGMDAADLTTTAAAAPPVAEAPRAPDSADDDAWGGGEDEGAVALADAPPPVPTPTPSPVALPRKVGQAPPLPPPTPSPARDPEQTAPHPALGMSTATREEVWAIVRAAVQDAIAPVVQQNKELALRLEAAERGLERERAEREQLVAQAREAVAAAASASARPPALASGPHARAGASIPVMLEPSIPPGPIVVPAAKAPRFDDAARLDLTPTAPRVMPTAKMPVRVPGGSIPPTGLGVVVTPGQSADLDLSKVTVSPLEIPDFGRRRRIMGRVLVALMLMAVAAAVVMTVLSHR